jgi:hypothetical protein
MLTMLNLKDVLRALCTAILMCGLVSPITIFANDSDGTRFSPNSFDVELNTMSSADLNVYSQGNTYNEFGLYRDLPFTTNISANLGFYNKVRTIDVAVKVKTVNAESSFQPAFSVSPSIEGGFPVSGQMSWLHYRTDLNHRALAGFAIEACQKNADSWVAAGNSLEGHFSTDHILPIAFLYKLKLNAFYTPSYRPTSTPENDGTYTQIVRLEKNIVCHRNTARTPRPPFNQYVVQEVKVNYSRVKQTQDKCGYFDGHVTIRTNQANQVIPYSVVQSLINPWNVDVSGEDVSNVRHFNIETDSNGVASGIFYDDINYQANGYRGDVSGSLRVISSSFESKALHFNINCNKPRVNLKKIKKVVITPTLQIPQKSLPSLGPINRPDAPDTRLQQNSNRPALKLQKPTFGIKQPIFNNRAVLKPVVPNSRVALPKKADAIKSTTPASSLKPMQPAASVPVLKPVLEKKRVPVLKLDLKD